MLILNPNHLLDQADKLKAPPSSGPPRQVDLRRAISSAYYALFHAIATAAADEFVGKTHRSSPRYALVYRSIGHDRLRQLCKDFIRPKLPEKYAGYEPKSGFGDELIAFATALVDLQERSHLADYDPLFRVKTTDAFLAIKTSRTALDQFGQANRTGQKMFLTLAIFPPRSISTARPES